MDMIKHILKSKTMMFALALAIFGVLEMNLKVFAPHFSPEFFGWFSILISVIVAILRVFTTLPLDKK